MGTRDPARPAATGLALGRTARGRPASAILALWCLTWSPGLALAGPLPAPVPVPRPPVAAMPSAPAIVPLPLPRPEEAGPPLPLPSVPPRPEAAGAAPLPRAEAFGPPPPRRAPDPDAPPDPDPVCGPLLAGGKVVARPAAAIAEGDACGVAAPVTLAAVVLRGGRQVALVPPAVMRCDLADRLADWVRDDVAPATAAEGDLLGIADAAAYVCRNRNWAAGARVSEHARGNAIDILAFRFARRTVGWKDPGARDVLAALRASACARFATVLGPGADAFHETDLHVDLEHRRNGFKLCQWTLP
ncbi:extensin family protein [Lichenibacterium ramalinae]|uniref:Extensin family protein n=1 Tax=Lichenibacterium ramalinae TaxID=2316527 RepID=A0A4Q2RGI9_9HYPH|nr:extensin family protein [Lichenibacterium ramalinae]